MLSRTEWQPISDLFAEDQTLFGSTAGPHLCNLSPTICELVHPEDGRPRRSSDKPGTCGCHGGHRDGDHHHFPLRDLFARHAVEQDVTPSPPVLSQLVTSRPAWRLLLAGWPVWRAWETHWKAVVTRTVLSRRPVPARLRRVWGARLARLRRVKLLTWRDVAQLRVDAAQCWDTARESHKGQLDALRLVARLLGTWHRQTDATRTWYDGNHYAHSKEDRELAEQNAEALRPACLWPVKPLAKARGPGLARFNEARWAYARYRDALAVRAETWPLVRWHCETRDPLRWMFALRPSAFARAPRVPAYHVIDRPINWERLITLRVAEWWRPWRRPWDAIAWLKRRALPPWRGCASLAADVQARARQLDRAVNNYTAPYVRIRLFHPPVYVDAALRIVRHVRSVVGELKRAA